MAARDPRWGRRCVVAVLHELLTGTPAFDPDTAAADRPDPAALRLPVGPLADLVRALLAPDPAVRPADATAVLRALHAARAGGDTIWPDFAVRPAPASGS